MTAQDMTTSPRGFRVRALGEVAIRCADLDRMEQFYADVIGLEKLADRSDGAIRFFRISDGYGGHTTVLALFDRALGGAPGQPVHAGAGSSLHHIALSIGWAEQDAAMAWYDRIDQAYRIEDFDWIGWRGVFTEDPEGNTVELVAARPGARA